MNARAAASPAKIYGVARTKVPMIAFCVPKAPWNRPTLCTFGYQNHSVRTAQWRYIRYADGGEELYDHTKDSYEWTNLAAKVEFKNVRSELAGWMPKTNVAEAKAARGAKQPSDDDQ